MEVYAIVYAVLIVGQVRMYMYVHSSSNSFSHIRVVIECDTLVSNLPNSFHRIQGTSLVMPLVCRMLP